MSESFEYKYKHLKSNSSGEKLLFLNLHYNNTKWSPLQWTGILYRLS